MSDMNTSRIEWQLPHGSNWQHESHVLPDTNCFYTGRLPQQLCFDDYQFETLWSMHPTDYHVIIMHGKPVKNTPPAAASAALEVLVGDQVEASVAPAAASVVPEDLARDGQEVQACFFSPVEVVTQCNSSSNAEKGEAGYLLFGS